MRRLSNPDTGDEVTVSALSLSAHAGTHLDAPSHFLPNGVDIESFSCAVANGPAQVIEISGFYEIGAAILRNALAPECRRLLVKTRNSSFWKEPEFRSDYVYLASDGADFLVEKSVVLVGIDYLSIGSFQPERDVHKRLLEAGTWILEGLDLSEVPAGNYDLVCLPLKIRDCEAAPARAFLAPPGTLRSPSG